MNISNSILSLSNLLFGDKLQTNQQFGIHSSFFLISVLSLPAILLILILDFFRPLVCVPFSLHLPYFQDEFPRKDGLDSRREDCRNGGKHPFRLECLQNEASKKLCEQESFYSAPKISLFHTVFCLLILPQTISSMNLFLKHVSRIFQRLVSSLLIFSYFTPIRAFAFRANTGNVWGSWPPFVFAFSAFKFCNRKRFKIFGYHNRNVDIFHTFNIPVIRLQSRTI